MTHAPFPAPPDIEAKATSRDCAPLHFGLEPAPYTPDTLKVIRKNAGKLTAAEIARAMGWTLKRLSKIAAEHRIDLSMPKEAEPRGA